MPKNALSVGLCLAVALSLLPREAAAPLLAGGWWAPSKELVSAADAIYAGEAHVIHEGKEDVINVRGVELAGRWATAEFVVDHVIRGEAAGLVEVKFFNPQAGSGIRIARVFLATVPADRRCMLLLRAPDEKGAPYTLLDPETRVILLSGAPPADLADENTETERLEAEIAAALGSDEPAVARQAVECVLSLGFSGKDVMAHLARLSDAPDPRIAARAVAARIELGDASAVSAARKLVESGKCPEGEIPMIGAALRKLTGAEYVSALKGLMTSKSAVLRRGASYALRENEAEDVIPVLAAALNDEDREVQYNAVLGMAKRVPQVPGGGPAHEIFLRDPDKYVQMWRDWWARNRAGYDEPDAE